MSVYRFDMVPFDQFGSLIHNPARVLPDDGIDITWKDPEPFEMRLKVGAISGDGRYVTLSEVHGIRTFPMRMPDLMRTLKKNVVEYGVVEATWIPQAKAANARTYGLRLHEDGGLRWFERGN